MNDTRPPGSRPRISVVVAHDGSRSRLRACLRSLAGQSPATHEVIVVQAGGGLAARRNIAAQAAVGDVLAFIAGDAFAHPGWANALAEAFRDGAAVAAGAIVEPDVRGGVSRAHDLHGLRDFLPSASAVNLAIRRDVFEDLGGFDPAVEGAEDRDLSFRAQLAGHALTDAKRAAVSVPHRTDPLARFRSARAQPALRRKYDHFVFHDALRSWHRSLVRVPGEALGLVELLTGRRPVPAFEEPSTTDQELAARQLPSLPSLVLVASRPADAAARARRTRDIAIPPPGLLADMLPQWDEPAPWAMRAARLAAQHGWPLPVLLTAKRLERERVSSWGAACLALHGIYAWAVGKQRYGLVISPSSSAELMSRIPELAGRTIAGPEAVWGMSAPRDPVLFVGGVERSGTTLLRNMLDAHPLLSLPDESYFIRNVHRELERRGEGGNLTLAWRLIQAERFFRQWELDPALVERAIARWPPQTYSDLIRALFAAHAERDEKPLSADKTPSHAYCFEWYAERFPESRFVHVLRDPREVCMALSVQPWYRRGVAGAAEKWAVTVRRARVAGAALGERYLEVRYEQLIDTPDAELRRLCRFSGLPFAPEMLAYPELTPVHPARHFAMSRQPPQAGTRPWREGLEHDDVAMIELIAGREMTRAGYEPVTTGARRRVRLRYRLERELVDARMRLERRLDDRAPVGT